MEDRDPKKEQAQQESDILDAAHEPQLPSPEDEGGIDSFMRSEAYLNPKTVIKRAGADQLVEAIPINDRILVRQDQASDTVGGTIYIGDNQKERPLEGEVLHVGPGRTLESGNLLPMQFAVGDRVMFGRFSGSDIKINGEELKILREDEVMVVLRPLTPDANPKTETE